MKRFLAGAGLIGYVAITAPSFLARVLTVLWNIGLSFNEQSLVMGSAALMLLSTRLSMLPQMIFVNIKTRITNMHIFYAGVVLVLFASTIMTFVPGGAIIITTIINLFSSNSLTGAQILQGFLVTLGVVFILVDFPHKGHVSPKF